MNTGRYTVYNFFVMKKLTKGGINTEDSIFKNSSSAKFGVRSRDNTPKENPIYDNIPYAIGEAFFLPR